MMKGVLLAILILLIPLRGLAQEEKVVVAKVLEGNILELENGEKVRLIGIESNKEAYEFTRRNIEGKSVRLEFDSHQKDEEGRLLGYVYFKSRFNKEIGYLDDDFPKELFLNAELIKKGYASPVASSNKKYSDLFEQLYQKKKASEKGFWD